MSESQLLISKGKSADILSISLRTLEKLIATNEICARKIGRRVLIERAELERFAHLTGPHTATGDKTP